MYENGNNKAGKLHLACVCVDIKTFNDAENLPLRLSTSQSYVITTNILCIYNNFNMCAYVECIFYDFIIELKKLLLFQLQ